MLNDNMEKSTTNYEYAIHEIFCNLHPEDKYNIVVYLVDYKNLPCWWQDITFQIVLILRYISRRYESIQACLAINYFYCPWCNCEIWKCVTYISVVVFLGQCLANTLSNLKHQPLLQWVLLPFRSGS